MNNSSKNLLSFVLGAAVGAGIAYLFLSEDGKKIISGLKDKADKLKDDLEDDITRGKSFLEELGDALTDSSPKA